MSLLGRLVSLLGRLVSPLRRLGTVLGGFGGVLEGPGERLGRLLGAFWSDLGSFFKLRRDLESILGEIQQNL